MAVANSWLFSGVQVMASRNQKLTAAAVAAALIGLTFLNRLYRASSRNDLPMFSWEALEAGWLYWLGMLIAAIGFIAYWICQKAKE